MKDDHNFSEPKRTSSDVKTSIYLQLRSKNRAFLLKELVKQLKHYQKYLPINFLSIDVWINWLIISAPVQCTFFQLVKLLYLSINSGWNSSPDFIFKLQTPFITLSKTFKSAWKIKSLLLKESLILSTFTALFNVMEIYSHCSTKWVESRETLCTGHDCFHKTLEVWVTVENS